MLNYLRESFKRKKARRITAEYPAVVNRSKLEKDGDVEFAVWQNPLYKYAKEITQPSIDFFRQFIKEGDVAIDIGANVGDITVPMAIAAGAQGTVFAFDPNPYVFEVLKKNASLNKGKTNIVPVNSAISASEEEFYFVSSEASFANGGISPVAESTHGKYCCPNKVKGVNLSEFLKQKESNRAIALIKIDAEGYDKEIIKSIADLIAEQKPVIIAESFGENSDEDKQELFQVISRHGYDIFFFEDFDATTKVEPIESAEGMLKWKNTIDIYALPK